MSDSRHESTPQVAYSYPGALSDQPFPSPCPIHRSFIAMSGSTKPSLTTSYSRIPRPPQGMTVSTNTTSLTNSSTTLIPWQVAHSLSGFSLAGGPHLATTTHGRWLTHYPGSLCSATSVSVPHSSQLHRDEWVHQTSTPPRRTPESRPATTSDDCVNQHNQLVQLIDYTHPMPYGLKRYQQAESLHFITFSCYTVSHSSPIPTRNSSSSSN
jgi:hypothetical protein